MFVTGWAPVTNMYETVVWVGGAAAVLGLALAWSAGAPVAAVAGTTVAALACVVGDVMPPALGRSIAMLPPVLQSNLWLTVHVLTVVSSYAAFALATVLANVALWRLQASRSTPALQTAADPSDRNPPPSATGGEPSHVPVLIYRCIQVGVVLIAAGTVLGALWADVSWGRFWGWDPKEVWALIVLLAYLALLHARSAGYVREFGWCAGAVVCFLTVLMSWYGVNFVLGAGLHSYGFGAGGAGYVMAYVIAQVGFVIWGAWRYRIVSSSALAAGRGRAGAGMPPRPATVSMDAGRRG
jgi:cytochrome c-type biogenesis protein CcsB